MTLLTPDEQAEFEAAEKIDAQLRGARFALVSCPHEAPWHVFCQAVEHVGQMLTSLGWTVRVHAGREVVGWDQFRIEWSRPATLSDAPCPQSR